MNERLTTRGLAELLAQQTGMENKRAEEFIDALSSYISQGIERNKVVKIMGFGTFKIVLVRERESVHIQTGERFVIPAHHKLSFVPDKDFKDQINRPFAFFEPIEATEEHLPKMEESVKTENKTPKKVTFVKEKETVVSETVASEPEEEIISSDVADMEEQKLTEEIPESPIADTGINYSTEEEWPEIEEDPIVPEEYEAVYPDDEYEVSEQETKPEEIYDFSEIEEPADVVVEKYGEIEEEELEEVEEETPEEHNMPATTEKKKKSAPLWLWFLLLPLLFVAGVGVGMYAFWHYTSNQPLKASQTLISKIDSEKDNTPLPIGVIPETGGYEVVEEGSVQDLIGGILDDNETAENQVTGEVGQVEEKIEENNDEAPTTTKKEEKQVIDWLAPSPENPTPRTETKRADKPNQEIEERNKKLTTNTAKTNTKPTASTTSKSTTTATTKSGSTSTTATGGAKKIPAKVRMAAGSSLTQVAMEYYGNTVFWVYIYEHNKSRIPNFNNVPVGTEITLPSPKTYGIDAKNEKSVQKAREKQRQLLKWDNWDDYR